GRVVEPASLAAPILGRPVLPVAPGSSPPGGRTLGAGRPGLPGTHAGALTGRLTFVATAAVAAFLWLGLGAGAGASESPYAASVDRAEAVLAASPPGDAVAAQSAAGTLRLGTGRTQPEILADLDARPPRTADARARLQALAALLAAPPSITDPAHARRVLARVLALPRFRGLGQAPSWWDLLAGWALSHLAGLLRAVGGQLLVALTLLGAFCALLLLLAVGGLALSGRGRMRSGLALAVTGGSPTPPPDLFALADSLAGAGRYAAAIRALAVGVAGRIAGDPGWEASQKTVREVFAGSEEAEGLRPLLVPFEESVYGHRPFGESAYRAARAVAEPYRTEGFPG
ncbi:MAG: hypothetical protein ACREPI_10195, partial [Candidatus Dormibacterales bacterium]